MRPFFFYLPAFLQGLSFRAFFDLPVSVHRYLAGPPVLEENGYELAPQFQSFLRYLTANNLSLSTPDDLQLTRDETAAAAVALQGGDSTSSNIVETRDIRLGQLKARLYNPLNTLPGRKPLLVYFHGGGWVFGNLNTHDGIVRRIAARSGVMVISVDYRLAPENPFPAAVNDAVEAFRYLAERKHHMGVRHLAIGGDSAGGNIAAAASHILCQETRPSDHCPKFQLLLYPVTGGSSLITVSRERFAKGFFLSLADMEWFAQQYCGQYCDDPHVNILALPTLTRFPQTYISIAGFDPLRDEGIMFANRLQRDNITVTYRLHHSLIHGFASFANLLPECAKALDAAADALAVAMNNYLPTVEPINPL